MSKRISAGLTLLELLLGVIIFSLAMLPLLSLTQSSTEGAYSISKHLIAGQICSNILDRILTMPFEKGLSECETIAGKEFDLLTKPNLILDDKTGPLISGLAAPDAKTPSFANSLNKNLETFKYSVGIEKSQVSAEENEEFLVIVVVKWMEDPKTERTLSRRAIKFKEDI